LGLWDIVAVAFKWAILPVVLAILAALCWPSLVKAIRRRRRGKQ
jgi:hypothetical protein